jgi:hypothetical protein
MEEKAKSSLMKNAEAILELLDRTKIIAAGIQHQDKTIGRQGDSNGGTQLVQRIKILRNKEFIKLKALVDSLNEVLIVSFILMSIINFL